MMLHAKPICMPRWRFGAVAVAAVLLLAACSDNDHDGTSMPPDSSQTQPGTTVDAFIAYVQSIVASVSDTTEPVAIDSVAVTTPENTEPVAVN